MAATLIFAVICVPAAVFLVRFLLALCGTEGRPARMAYGVQIRPGQSGDGDSDKPFRPQKPDLTAPFELQIPNNPWHSAMASMLDESTAISAGLTEPAHAQAAELETVAT